MGFRAEPLYSAFTLLSRLPFSIRATLSKGHPGSLKEFEARELQNSCIREYQG
jgi:hypothetical protein